MKTLTKTLTLAVALVLGAAAPAVWAQPHPMGGMARMGADGGPGPHGGPGRHLIHALQDVGVPAATITQIEALFKTAREELKPLHEQGQQLRQQSMALWAAPNIDAAALEAVRKQQQALHDKVSARMQQAFVDAGRLLSPEQRAKLASRVKVLGERMKERRGG